MSGIIPYLIAFVFVAAYKMGHSSGREYELKKLKARRRKMASLNRVKNDKEVAK